METAVVAAWRNTGTFYVSDVPTRHPCSLGVARRSIQQARIYQREWGERGRLRIQWSRIRRRTQPGHRAAVAHRHRCLERRGNAYSKPSMRFIVGYNFW